MVVVNSIENLKVIGTHDALTGLVNRMELGNALKRSIAKTKKKKNSIAFLVVGIDNLAMINQAYGLDVADDVICAVAKRITKLLRKSDVIGRYSGNKFGIILHNCDENNINVAAKRLTETISKAVIQTEDEAVAVTMSAGAVSIPKHSQIPQDIMQFAEEALISAKSLAIDSFTIYEQSISRENYREKNIKIANQIVEALNDRRVKVVYQPIVEAKTGIVKSYECLVRVLSESGDVIPNNDLIPVAEQLNLMRLLDHRVLEIALQTLYDNEDAKLAINISPKTIADSNWYNCLLAGLVGKKHIGERLTIEITETALLNDIDDANAFISKLHALGCLIALDDFGTGYTSFQNLKNLDIDIVKIDGVFIQNICENNDNQFFVKMMGDLAKHFNVKTVAEWVENEADVAQLCDIGIDYLQGFYFGAGEAELHIADSDGKVVLGAVYQKNRVQNTAMKHQVA